MSSILTEILFWYNQRRMCREFDSHRHHIWYQYSGAITNEGCVVSSIFTKIIFWYITNEGCVVSSIHTDIIFGIQERAHWRRYEWL